MQWTYQGTTTDGGDMAVFNLTQTAQYVTVYNVTKTSTASVPTEDSSEPEYLYKTVDHREVIKPGESITITPKYDNQELEAEPVYALNIKDCTVIEDNSFVGDKVDGKWYVKAGQSIKLKASAAWVKVRSNLLI